jgi:carboxylesterase type B
LFKRAILQSPAFQWLWNRKGDLDHTFSVFSKRVALEEKCEKADMACLRSASTATLQKVNQKLYERQACEGVMPIGPSVDGNLVPDIATNAFAQGKGEVFLVWVPTTLPIISSFHHSG